MNPLPASTVVLLRNGSSGPELFLVQKAKNLEFAAGAYVFPGGTVGKQDADPEWFSFFFRFTREELERSMPDIDPLSTLGFHVAAMRELCEEAGVLLTGSELDERRRRRIRKALLKGESFLETAREMRLSLNPSGLVFFAHWITPEAYPVRFDTRFFLTELPSGEAPTACGRETVNGIWISPAEALQRSAEGTLSLLPPTRVTLEELATFGTAEEALLWGKNRVKSARRPWVDGKGVLHLT